jgi:hypothetical protein
VSFGGLSWIVFVELHTPQEQQKDFGKLPKQLQKFWPHPMGTNFILASKLNGC